MNYPPPHHQDHNREHMIEVIKMYPLAMVVSVDGDRPVITHLPLIYSEGKLLGHLDKNNPQAQLLKDDREVTVVFSGPQCYISPSIYKANTLPTWNYVMVHLQGTVSEIADTKTIIQSMIDMTSYLEAPNHLYVLHPDNPRMAQFINYVAGFEIDIRHWEGKFKLSQDKSHEDMESAKEELIRSNHLQIKDFLNRVL